MQTFLPLPDLKLSVQILDKARLGKQRVEAFQLLKAISGTGSGWSRHPAAKMWRGFENALVTYALHAHDEWIKRGCVDTTRDRMQKLFDPIKPAEKRRGLVREVWVERTS